MFQRSSEHAKVVAWSNSSFAYGKDPAVWRIDCDGRTIKYCQYGELNEFGWEIDHAVPIAVGGTDDGSNLRARHWRGNRSAGGYLGNALSR
jgi:HNH endonuclease